MAQEIKQTTSAEQVLEWSKIRGVTILVTLPGSGGSYVKVDKFDFQRSIAGMINPLRATELEATYYFEPVRKNLYAA